MMLLLRESMNWPGVVCFLFFSGAAFGSGEYLWDVRDGKTCSVGMIAAAQHPSLVRAKVTELLGSGVRLGKLTLLTRSEDRSAVSGQGGTECDYESWRRVLSHRRQQPSSCPAITEVLKIGADVLVRRSDRDCTHRVVSVPGGRRTLDFVAAGTRFQILDVAVSARSEIGDNVGATFFVQSESFPTVERAREILAYLKRVTEQGWMTVILRRDEWFPVLATFRHRSCSVS